MDVKELRLGNLVEYDGLPCKVKLIEESGLAVLFEDGEDIWIDIWQFCPISITEKWLLKFGFEKKNYDSYFQTKKWSDGQNIITVTDDECFVEMENTFHKRCEYVHQLQNLYHCLTGKELTYE